jgi:hypothetical protein
VKTKTNYEGMFFGMIVLAWAVLAVVFNIVHHTMPTEEHAGAKTTKAALITPAANEVR